MRGGDGACLAGAGSLAQGLDAGAAGLWVLGGTIWSIWNGAPPEAHLMGAVGISALIANAGVAMMLYRFRSGDANMRSVWICSRNDAIGNVAVVAAAAGVFGTCSAWPNLIVAGIMAGLGLWGGWQIIRQVCQELALSPATESHSAMPRTSTQ